MIYMIAGSLFISSFGTSCWLSTRAALARSGLRSGKRTLRVSRQCSCSILESMNTWINYASRYRLESSTTWPLATV